MKRFFEILGIVCTVIVAIVLALSVYGYIEYKNNADKIEKQTKALATQYVKTISAAWNPEDLQKLSHPLLKEAMAKQGQSFGEFFNVYRKLGGLKNEPICTLVNAKDNIGIPAYIMADYTCNAQYENASAVISIELFKNFDSNNTYLITVYRMDSDLFVKLMGK